uniref:Alpha-D-phosphohexomutase alpha/beta/alpha domain-containing protein n=1 Tax=Ditylenchus dipsaci TaxID=166011 RepID=A0A915DKA6_9BILA
MHSLLKAAWDSRLCPLYATACAVDRVAKANGKPCFEVPTGWKYFGNLMDAGKLSLCGEESLELAQTTFVRRTGSGQIVTEHWKKYGRNVFTRYDYENVDASQPTRVVVANADNYEYVDPVDQSWLKIRAGTGSAGATIRLYVESVVEASDTTRLLEDAQTLLKPLVLVALNICKLEQFTGRTQPTVIT